VTEGATAVFRADLGEGALLRRYSLDDLDDLWALVQAERERIGVWMPWVASTTTIETQRAWLERASADEGLDGCGIWVGDRYAGGVGLRWDPFGIAGELGYWIGSEFEGRGLVTRACRALIDHGFGVLRLHRIAIRAGVENTRSRAIPERLGFTREGVLRGEGRGSDGFYDLVVYGLLEDEWPRP
jgi:ribosomal-protein-serine acetyltransferase